MRMRNKDDIAVIIPCHNYGRYLAEAIESVLSQSVPASEIVIVDDASNDNTREVAEQYASKSVRYIRGEWHASGHARNAGLAATTAPFVVFLDADDMLDADYLRCGLEVFQSHPDAGIAYSDYRCFGDKDHLHTRPDTLDWRQFDMVGDLSVVSMLHRDAVMQAGKWHTVDNLFLDWLLFRKMMNLGWKAYKSQGHFWYRVHGGSQFHTMRHRPYAELAGLLNEPVSILVTLSGDEQQWNAVRKFLEHQTFPHALGHLFLLNTSGNTTFGNSVRAWLAQSDYQMQSYFASAHRDALGIGDALLEMLNRVIRMTNTPIVWMLSEVQNLPADAYQKMVSRFGHNVLSVAAPCSHTCLLHGGQHCFCCNIIRGEFLRRIGLSSGAPHGRYEDNFFHTANPENTWTTVVESITNVSAPSIPKVQESEEPITVVTASDENYSMGLAAMGYSLGASHRGQRRIELVILDGGISEETKAKLHESWRDMDMTIRWMTPDVSAIEHLPLKFWFTRATYLRLLIPDLLPQTLNKAIYMDCDVLVLKDIEELWNVELGEHPIGAVQDMKLPNFGKAFLSLDGLPPADTPYYHSGMLLMNLQKWRERDLTKKIIQFIEDHSATIRWIDQDGINAVLAHSCLPLDPRWNVSIESFTDAWEKSPFDRDTFTSLTTNPSIVHFATRSKPWHAECKHPKTPLFFQFLDNTAWHGWRPDLPALATCVTEATNTVPARRLY